NGNLIIQYSENDYIRIMGGIINTSGSFHSDVGERLERIEFHDNTVWDLTGGLHLKNNGTSRTIYGTTDDDVIESGSGSNTLYGGLGADTFVFTQESASGSLDYIKDFNIPQGDKIDISDLLSGYDPLQDAIADFIKLTQSGSHTTLAIDLDGSGLEH